LCGKEAVQILDATGVDLVVTDLRMPKMDGFELLAHMSGNYPDIPVIVMTAYGTPC
jgi:CheY-like chemotaxis protein